ncbi:T9SS type A sorting domain-containing protein [Bacteroidota bacterium]
MLNKFFTLFFGVLLFSSFSFGQSVIFEDNFDSYTAGVQLACQNPVDWTTWSNAPCGSEDGMVTTDQASSTANSVNIIANNDQLKLFPQVYTTGKYSMKFKMYIATGLTGYFNCLSSWNSGSPQWAMQVYFNNGGAGNMDAGGALVQPFTYPHDTWMDVEVICDLDLDVGEFWLNGTMIHTWQWSLGTFGTGELSLEANNFFGGGTDGVPDYYFDDYVVTDLLFVPPVGVIFEDNFDSYTAGVQLACQNPIDWTTWSNAPCGSEDGMVTTDQAASTPNSVNIIPNNDQLKLFPQVYTTGKYSMAFKMYIANGLAGYFNCLSSWNSGSPQWAMQVYFNSDGNGNLDAGGALVQPFAYPFDTWMDVEVICDLDSDVGEFWLDGTMIHTWQWSLGTFGTGELSLEANNFFGGGATGTVDYYFDDYEVIDLIVIPVELTSFVADVNAAGNVVLNWTTATELNNQMFEIERRSENSEFYRIGYVDGHGTTTEAQQYSYVDNAVETGTYFYRLKQLDFNGRYDYSEVVEVEVNGPLSYGLEQNYPNPFNPSTNIRYSVLESGLVRLAVYNLIGEEVSVLVNGQLDAGFHEVTFDASNLPSGAYFYKLQAGNTVQIKKMLLMK